MPGHAAITWTYDSATNTWHTRIGGVLMTTTNIVIITTAYTTKHVSALRKDLTFADPLGTGKATVVAGDSTISATLVQEELQLRAQPARPGPGHTAD